MSKVTTKELIRIWGYVAAHSFGGPAGQIAVIHKLVVEDKKIISEERFLHALNFCMLLPGPEAQQLATYMGWLMGKWRGGLIAGSLFILPGFISILSLSYIYVLFKDVSFVQGLFYGVKPAIIAIVLSALYKISHKALKSNFHWILALLAFVALFFMNISFPFIVVFSALAGVVYGSFNTQQKIVEKVDSKTPRLCETALTFSSWLIIWLLPIALALLFFDTSSTFHVMNIFFSQMSLVTFGGAYAALSYVAQQGVEVYGWLQPGEMLDGLALAETTPGPLIQVVQYVGFMGAYRFPGVLGPLSGAFLGSVIATWMTFAPCFLFIFTLAPYVEFIRGKTIFSNALSAITASVVGVICNLSLWFVLSALFLESNTYQKFILDFRYPVVSSIDYFASVICIVALIMQFKLKSSLFRILAVSTSMGVLGKIAFL